MHRRGMICFLMTLQMVFGYGENFQKNSFLLKLVNHTLPPKEETFQCKYKCAGGENSDAEFLARPEPRFTDGGGTNGTADDDEMEAPTPKFSIFNLLSGDEEEDEDDEIEYDEKVQNEGEDGDMDFFGSGDISPDKVEGTKGENFLKQYHRQGLRMHNLVFPLLMAYKLKFFTVIPLLLGALVLLVGTTGIAGFFFALFAAAIGIHVKSHDQ